MAFRSCQPTKTLLLSCVLAAATAGGLYAQAPTPAQEFSKDHPNAPSPDRRQRLSDLTELIADGEASGDPALVPRKNFIDEHIFGKMELDGIPHAALSRDTEFFRRIHLDLTGRIPDSEEVRQFVASEDPEKRDKLIEKLIGSKAYLERWSYWFGDLARAGGSRVGTDGRNLFYRFIYDSLQFNQPFDELVRELILARALSNWYVGPASYLVRWVQFGDACHITMHEDTADEMTVSLFKHFMGLNLQCVSCHDGADHLEKLNIWLTERKRRELWQQAAFFGKTRVLRRTEVSLIRDEYSILDSADGYHGDAPSTVRVPRTEEGLIEPAFILTGEKPDPNKPLRQELARMFTAHPQFARATVNRFWAEMMGVGIVDPPDQFDMARIDPSNPPGGEWSIQPSHPELLEALTKDFRENGYDLRRLFQLITESSTYQLSSRFPGEWKDSYAQYFARKFARRMTAEQVYDAVVKTTGLYTEIPVPKTDFRAKFLTQTRGPLDITTSKYLAKDWMQNLEYFLGAFGQANRESNDPDTNGSITQAVLMMNGPFIKSKIKAEADSYLGELLKQEPKLSEEDLAEELFLRFLSRWPTGEEKSESVQLLAERGRVEGGEDLQWVLMNKLDFIFNY